MSKKLNTLEIEILKTESALGELDAELLKKNPSYAKLKALSNEVIRRGKRIRKAVRRDKQYFKVQDD